MKQNERPKLVSKKTANIYWEHLLQQVAWKLEAQPWEEVYRIEEKNGGGVVVTISTSQKK